MEEHLEAEYWCEAPGSKVRLCIDSIKMDPGDPGDPYQQT